PPPSALNPSGFPTAFCRLIASAPGIRLASATFIQPLPAARAITSVTPIRGIGFQPVGATDRLEAYPTASLPATGLRHVCRSALHPSPGTLAVLRGDAAVGRGNGESGGPAALAGRTGGHAAVSAGRSHRLLRAKLGVR